MIHHEKLFKSLADINRLKILDRLCVEECECSVTQLSKCCQVDLSVVSRHLKTLREAGVIHSVKKGKEVLYQVNRKEVSDFLRQIADRIEFENCCNTPAACESKTIEGETYER